MGRAPGGFAADQCDQSPDRRQNGNDEEDAGRELQSASLQPKLRGRLGTNRLAIHVQDVIGCELIIVGVSIDKVGLLTASVFAPSMVETAELDTYQHTQNGNQGGYLQDAEEPEHDSCEHLDGCLAMGGFMREDVNDPGGSSNFAVASGVRGREDVSLGFQVR